MKIFLSIFIMALFLMPLCLLSMEERPRINPSDLHNRVKSLEDNVNTLAGHTNTLAGHLNRTRQDVSSADRRTVIFGENTAALAEQTQRVAQQSGEALRRADEASADNVRLRNDFEEYKKRTNKQFADMNASMNQLKTGMGLLTVAMGTVVLYKATDGKCVIL